MTETANDLPERAHLKDLGRAELMARVVILERHARVLQDAVHRIKLHGDVWSKGVAVIALEKLSPPTRTSIDGDAREET